MTASGGVELERENFMCRQTAVESQSVLIYSKDGKTWCSNLKDIERFEQKREAYFKSLCVTEFKDDDES
jgi:hypothetical protein